MLYLSEMKFLYNTLFPLDTFKHCVDHHHQHAQSRLLHVMQRFSACLMLVLEFTNHCDSV